MTKTKETMKALNDTVTKSMDEYIALGTKVQDEMFQMAQKQLDGFRQYTEFALKQQTEFFSQFEKNAKSTRELWVEGLKKWRESVEDLTPKQ